MSDATTAWCEAYQEINNFTLIDKGQTDSYEFYVLQKADQIFFLKTPINQNKGSYLSMKKDCETYHQIVQSKNRDLASILYPIHSYAFKEVGLQKIEVIHSPFSGLPI